MCLVPPKGLSVSMSSAAHPPCDVTVWRAGGLGGRLVVLAFQSTQSMEHSSGHQQFLRGGVGDSLKLDGPVAGISRRIVYEGPSSSWTRRATTGMRPPRACPTPMPPVHGPRTYVYTRRVNQTRRVCVAAQLVLYTPRVSQQHGPLLCPFRWTKEQSVQPRQTATVERMHRTQGTSSSSLPPPLLDLAALPQVSLYQERPFLRQQRPPWTCRCFCCEATPPL